MTPLLRVTLAFAAGALAGLRLAPSSVLVLLLCTAAAVALCVRARPAVVAAAFCIGAACGGLRANRSAGDCRAQLAERAAVVVTGVPLVLPTPGVTTPFLARTVRSRDVTCANVRIRVRVPPRHADAIDSAAVRSTSLVLYGRWMAYPARSGWPRNPEHAGGLLADSIAPGPATLRADGTTRIRIAQQRRIRALLPARAGLAEALLLAQKAGLTPDVRNRWVAAGLVHLLAISGMHVGLIAAGVVLLGRAARLPRRTARRVAIAITAAYVLFLGAPTAALRALLQAAALLLSLELQRPAEPFTLLGAAALLIAALDPAALLDPGFHLSFAGMIGLIGWRRPIAAALPPWLPRYVREGIAAGIAASALTTPVAALHFGTASWTGIPASLIAVPVMSIAIAALCAALLLAPLLAPAAALPARIADAALRALDGIAGLAARVPFGHGYIAGSTVLLLLAGAAVALLVWSATRTPAAPPAAGLPPDPRERRRQEARRRALRIGLAAASALAAVAWMPLLLRAPGASVEIHAIDVGQGDAFAIRTPRGRWLLVDAGPRTPRSDAGRDRVVPYLLARGARRIEALVLTHPDADHIGGAAAVLDAFAIGLVIDPGFPAGKDMFIDLLAAARHGGQRWIAAREGIAFTVDGVEIALLYPSASLDAAPDANDNSVVFRLAFGSFAALFFGDAPASVERRLVDRHGQGLRAAVLKVGHHGSATSTGEELLAAARPGIALISAGRNNRYGHPNPGVLRRLERHQVRVLRTDLSGNLVVRATRDGNIEVLARRVPRRDAGAGAP